MTCRVVIRPRADADIDHYFLHIEQHSPDAAVRFLDAIQATFNAIAEFPDSGTPRDFVHPSLQGLRSCPIIGFPNHLLFYRRVDEQSVTVIRLLHAAMDYLPIVQSEGLN